MNFIKQPYPYFHGGSELIRNAALILILAFLFEYLFEPFNVTRSEHLFDYGLIVLIHSTQSAITYLVLFVILGFFFSQDDWKIYKEVLALSLLFFLVGINGFFLRDFIYDNPNNGSISYFIEEVRNTMLVGSVILFVIIVINFNLLNKKNQQRANSFQIDSLSNETNTETIDIRANIPSDHFELVPSDILCIRSGGNYLEFFLKEEVGSKKLLKRLTLQSALEQLVGYPGIVKTHRTFLVNINHLEKVTGNAQGYQLAIKNLDFTVPVSRGHIRNFNKLVR